MGLRRQFSDSLLQRRAEVLRQHTAIEAPRVLWLIVAIIVLFDLGYAAIGIVSPLGYYISDVLQSAVLIAVAVALQRGAVPTKWAPSLVMVAVVANNVATTYQATIVGEGALGVIAILLAVAGAIALEWRAFLVGSVVCIVNTTLMLHADFPDSWSTWAITMLTATAVGGVILYGRSQSGMNLAQAQETIERMATIDNLTDLLNRHGLHEHVGVIIAQARRLGTDFFVAFIDVAGLKHVNDDHGHAAGDRVLQRVADSLRRHCRSQELLCRWGGDEFIIVGTGECPDPDHLGQRLVDGIDTNGIDHMWRPALWVGAAAGSPTTHNLEMVLAQADEDMLSRRPAENGGR